MRIVLLFLFLAILLSCAFSEACPGEGVLSAASLPVHNVRTGLDYATIQSSVDANETLNGDTILVDEGVYAEHVWVRKSLNIVGANVDTTIVDSMGSFRGFLVYANRVNITGFTVQNAVFAIYLNSSENRVCGNKVRSSKIGIRLDSGGNNTVSGNIIDSMILDGEGVYLENTVNNVIRGNLFTNNSYALSLVLSTRNMIKENTIRNCSSGIWLQLSSDNIIHHNNFVDNSEDARVDYSFNNVWDDGYPSGGNFWSGYNRSDLNQSTYQNITGSDGIGDVPHVIAENNKDDYPLMGSINVFDAGTYHGLDYCVDVVSNFTVSAFGFNATEGPFIRFNVTGQNGTDGFSRVTIPKDLLWVEDGWNVTIDGEPIDYSANADESRAYLYFTYRRNVGTIEIQGTDVISEFPTLSILLSSLILAAFVIGIPKKH